MPSGPSVLCWNIILSKKEGKRGLLTHSCVLLQTSMWLMDPIRMSERWAHVSWPLPPHTLGRASDSAHYLWSSGVLKYPAASVLVGKQLLS